MTQATPFTASYSETAEFERPEDGLHQAVIGGVTLRDFADYNDKTKTVEKLQFILQCAQDGQTFYFRTKPMANILGEKSNLMIFLASATGATLEKIKEKYPIGFPLKNLVGVPVQAVVNTVTGKDGKEYANLANVLKAKKGTKTAVVQDAIPAYLVRGAKEQFLADCLTVKEETNKAATFPQGLPGGVASGAAVPQMPANAQVTQNQNAAAFMGVTNPAPQPAAPDIQTAEQAMAQEGLVTEGDDDGDLPF